MRWKSRCFICHWACRLMSGSPMHFGLRHNACKVRNNAPQNEQSQPETTKCAQCVAHFIEARVTLVDFKLILRCTHQTQIKPSLQSSAHPLAPCVTEHLAKNRFMQAWFSSDQAHPDAVWMMHARCSRDPHWDSALQASFFNIDLWIQAEEVCCSFHWCHGISTRFWSPRYQAPLTNLIHAMS